MTWIDLGLPAAIANSYGYTTDAGLRRTSQSTAEPRQKRDYATDKREFSVSFLLTTAQLRTAENYLQEYGYTWFPLPLSSGDSTEGVSTLYVKLIDDPTITAAGSKNAWAMAVKLEQYVAFEQSVFVTTTLYPQDAEERFYLAAPGPLTWVVGGSVIYDSDQMSCTAPPSISGTLVLTHLHAWAEPDSTNMVAPSISGTLILTQLHTYVLDTVGAAAPSISGQLDPYTEAFVFGSEDTGVSAPTTISGTLA
jgi:hypothetical protein